MCVCVRFIQVHFSDKANQVIVLDEWAEDTIARRGTWVQDRVRFEYRIRETDKLIGYVFYPDHRKKIMPILKK